MESELAGLGAGSGEKRRRSLSRFPIRLVAVGASTGGPTAIQKILKGLPENFPVPIVLVQHISPDFVLPFVEWLRPSLAVGVEVASEGMIVRPGIAYIAPGDWHLTIDRERSLRLDQRPPINACRPSIDPLFSSVAEVYGRTAVGVLLTGMGIDGAGGLSQLRERGGRTIVQDEESAVIFGMPRAAIEKNAAEIVLPLSQIPSVLRRWVGAER
jgi:two-component system chemotaxis response regulator CheB